MPKLDRFAALLVSAALGVASGCGAAAPPTCATTKRLEPSRYAPRILPSEEHTIDSPECATSPDCGVRAHAQMQCFHDLSCMPLCEAHWGDCNHDYRDGCETAIAHRHYCDGDPRIAEELAPSAFFSVDTELSSSDAYSAGAFSRGIARHEPALERCYQDALARAHGLKGSMSYELTLQRSGCVTLQLGADEVKNRALQECIARVLERIRFADPPKAQVTFPFEARFDPGGVVPED